MANHAGSSSSSRVQPSRLLFAAAVALLSFACTPAHAQVIRSDNSPVCNTYLPQCEAKCKRGEAYIFVCSAGNGPRGGPYLICRCAAPKLPVGPAQQSARLVLANWPGSKACNDKTWINDCTSQMTAQVNGTRVTLTPTVSSAFNEKCDPVPGVVIGPKGTQAAVSFPQYPIGLTNTGPDGTLQIDFSMTAADDPNNMDWSQCIVTYKIIQGQFLNPLVGMQGGGLAAMQAQAQQQQGGRPGARSSGGSSRWQLGVQLAAGLLAAAAMAVAL